MLTPISQFTNRLQRNPGMLTSWKINPAEAYFTYMLTRTVLHRLQQKKEAKYAEALKKGTHIKPSYREVKVSLPLNAVGSFAKNMLEIIFESDVMMVLD